MAPRGENKPVKSDDTVTKRKKAFFKQRFPAFKKKATELSVLCGNSVGFICYGPDEDNDLHVWPENRQALQHIVAKFNAQSDFKKKRDGCDLSDFANLESFSVAELKKHLSDINSHLIGVREKKFEVVMKKMINGSDTSSDLPRISENSASAVSGRKSKPGLEDTVSDDDLLKVSDQKEAGTTKLGFGGAFDELGYVVSKKSTVSDDNLLKVSDREEGTTTNLCFGGVFDELGYVVRGSDGSVRKLEFSGGGDYLPAAAEPMPIMMYNHGFCSNDGIWDSELFSNFGAKTYQNQPLVLDSLQYQW